MKELRDISGKTTKYVYDPANRLKQVFDECGSQLVEYAYNPDNTVASKLYGNGILTSYAYDGDRNLTELKAVTSKGNTLSLMSFSYDLNGNLLKKQEQDHVTHYSYDSLNRLTKAVYDSTQEAYSYDMAGNRIEKVIGDTIEKYTYNAKNQLTQIYRDIGTTSFFYDNQGNLTMEAAPDGASTFGYDALNRQIQAVMKDGNTLVSRYDAEGLRAEIEENEKLTRFIFHKGNILTELDRDYAPIAHYTRGNSLVAQTLWNPESKAQETYYHHQDQQGSTIHISDAEENIRNSYRYDAFGMFLENRETIPNRITYTGQQYDSITGQYYLRARYYNPVIGRFTQEDPYRGDGLNLYAYVSNNPVSYYDPTGYSKCDASGESNKLHPWGDTSTPSIEWLTIQGIVRRTVEMAEIAINYAKEKAIPEIMNTLSNALYGKGPEEKGGVITCDFDGYNQKKVKGRHEGIDFLYEKGANVYSLTNGEVIKVVEGKPGGRDDGKNSYIFIYDEENDKTVIYMHSDPKIEVGAKIEKGSIIAVEDDRGANTHTHVEVRAGKKYQACNSVNDFKLENEDPTSYWNSLGYEVK